MVKLVEVPLQTDSVFPDFLNHNHHRLLVTCQRMDKKLILHLVGRNGMKDFYTKLGIEKRREE